MSDSDIGPDVLGFLFDEMKIDEAWSVREPRSFTWWGYRLAQRVWISPIGMREDRPTTVLNIETDVVRDVSLDVDNFGRLAAVSRFASLSRFIWDTTDQTVKLRCAITLDSDRALWAKRLALLAMGVQAEEAHRISPELSRQLGGKVDVTAHPSTGPRGEPDEMLSIIEGAIRPRGETCIADGEGEIAGLKSAAEPLWSEASWEPTGVRALLPGPEGRGSVAVLSITMAAQHPLLGRGALFQLFGFAKPSDDTGVLACGLNELETREPFGIDMLGAWCADAKLGPVFVAFLPAVGFQRGLVRIMAAHLAARAAWASEARVPTRLLREAVEAENRLRQGRILGRVFRGRGGRGEWRPAAAVVSGKVAERYRMDDPVWETHIALGVRLLAGREFAEAEAMFVAAERRATALEPSDLRLAEACRHRGRVRLEQHQLSQARSFFLDAIAGIERVLGPNDPRLSRCLIELGGVYSRLGQHAEAERVLRRAVEILGPSEESDDPDAAVALNNLAEVYRAQERYAQAEPLYRLAVRIEQRARGEEGAGVAASLQNLAGLCHELRRYDEAEDLYRRALDIKKKAHGPEHPEVALTLGNLGGLYFDCDRYEEARRAFLTALEIDERALGADNIAVARDLNNLGSLWGSARMFDLAQDALRRSLAIAEKVLGPDHENVATTLSTLASILEQTGRADEANTLRERAAAIRATLARRKW